MRLRALLLLLACVVVAAALAACGGDDDEDGERLEPISEWSLPSGEFEGERPRAVIILIHGGGWKGLDRTQFEGTLAQAPVFTEQGYAVLTVDYRSGAAGLTDLERFYDEAAGRFGPGVPVCAVGSSAGGHLALMLAAREPELDCAVDLAGPPNLASLAEQGAEKTHGFASDAFGEENLAEFSPVRYADRIRAEVFAAGAENDPLVPVEQLEELERALPEAETMVLDAGEERWIHSTVDAADKEELNRSVNEFLDRVARRRGGDG